MNDLLYYEPLANLFEADVMYRSASTQVRFGYLTLAASFHWNLLKLLGDISPTYHLAPPAADDDSTLVQLPYLNGSLKLHVKADGVSSDDWLEHASATLLAEVHSNCMAPLLCVNAAVRAACRACYPSASHAATQLKKAIWPPSAGRWQRQPLCLG